MKGWRQKRGREISRGEEEALIQWPKMPRKELLPALLPGLLPEGPPVRILAERETGHKIALPIKGKRENTLWNLPGKLTPSPTSRFARPDCGKEGDSYGGRLASSVGSEAFAPTSGEVIVPQPGRACPPFEYSEPR